jgi:hypothetical protein
LKKDTSGFRTEESFGGKNRAIIKTPNPDVNDSRNFKKMGFWLEQWWNQEKPEVGFLIQI